MVFSRVSILHWSLSAVIQLWDTHQHHRREKSQSAPGAIHSMLRLSNCYNHSVILASAPLFELCLSHSQCQCWITLLWRIFDCCRGAVITLPINNKQVFHLRGFIYGWILLSQGRPIFNHIQPIPARWPPHYTPKYPAPLQEQCHLLDYLSTADEERKKASIYASRISCMQNTTAYKWLKLKTQWGFCVFTQVKKLQWRTRCMKQKQ